MSREMLGISLQAKSLLIRQERLCTVERVPFISRYLIIPTFVGLRN